jgi:hypothetical protein
MQLLKRFQAEKRSTRRWISRAGIAAFVLCVTLYVSSAAFAQELWTMQGTGGAGNASKIVKINVGSTPSIVYGIGIHDPNFGDNFGQDWTTIAVAPDRTLYVMRRFQQFVPGSSTEFVHIYSVPADSIHLNDNPADTIPDGVVDNLTDRGSTGLQGNVDGVTVGPDGNLYFVAFDTKGGLARNGLYRFRTATSTTEFVGTFANQTLNLFPDGSINFNDPGTNVFFTDLAFDPITGDLVGDGVDPAGHMTLYRIDRAAALLGINQTFQWDWFGGPSGAWNGKELRSAFEPFPDGVAFNNVNGDLYLSSDGQGVARFNRTTAAFEAYVAPDAGPSSFFGYDLAAIAVQPPQRKQAFCTFTQGGWGNTPAGHNPGSILAANFATVYPGGVTIGGIKTLKFTSALAVRNFLPQGGTPKALTASAVNPTGKITVFAGQVLALRINVDFGAAGVLLDANGDPVGNLAALRLCNFAAGDLLGDTPLTAAQATALNTKSVANILADANTALGGGALPSYVSNISQLSALTTLLNEAFDNCVATAWAKAHLCAP